MAPRSRVTAPRGLTSPDHAARRAAWEALWRVLLRPPSDRERNPAVGEGAGRGGPGEDAA